MKEFNIHITSNLTGISQHTLRAWEKRYKIIVPKRNSSGHRIFNEQQIEHLKILNKLCLLGYKISQLKEKSISTLNALLEKSGIKIPIEETFNIDENPVMAKQSLDNLLLALEEYRLDIVSHEFYNIIIKLSYRDLALNVISPLMASVGRKVLENRLSIDQEHALSSIIKFHLGQIMYKKQNIRKKNNNIFVLTTPESDYHEFGILLSALLCSHYDQKFYYLGPNLPANALVKAAAALDANYIILGSINSYNKQKSGFLDDFLLTTLRGIHKDTKLLCGGTGLFDFSKFKRKNNFEFFSTLNHLDKFLQGLLA